jgi:hypothetical protein
MAYGKDDSKVEKTALVRFVKFNRWFIKTFGFGVRFRYERHHISFLKGWFGRSMFLIGMEVGVYEGDNARNLLRAFPNLFLTMVDPYEIYKGYESDGSINYLSDAERKARKNTERFGRGRFLKEYSLGASKTFSDGALDFVYIDANHSYKYVKQDMNLWWRKIKKGGVMAGHDIDTPDILFAFCEFIKKNHIKKENISTDGEDWVIIK